MAQQVDITDLNASTFKCLEAVYETNESHLCNSEVITLGTKSIPIPSVFRQCKLGIVDHMSEGRCKLVAEHATINRHRMTDELYSRIRPAIRRATLMMDFCEPFFAKIMFSSRTWEMKRRFALAGSTCFDQNWKYTEENRKSYENALAAVFESVRINFTRQQSQPMQRCWGITSRTLFYLHGSTQHRFVVDIHLSPSFLDFYDAPDYYNFGSEVQGRAEQRLADTLVHELAHAINGVRAFSCKCTGVAPYLACVECKSEPFYAFALNRQNQHTGELGHAWEYYFYGDIPSPRTSDISMDLRMTDHSVALDIVDILSETQWMPAQLVPHAVIGSLSRPSMWIVLYHNVSFEDKVQKAEQESTLNMLSRIANALDRKRVPHSSLPVLTRLETIMNRITQRCSGIAAPGNPSTAGSSSPL